MKTIPLPHKLNLGDKLVSTNYSHEVLEVVKIDEHGRITLARVGDGLAFHAQQSRDALVAFDYRLIVYDKEMK